MTEQAEPTRLIRGGEASMRSLLQSARRDGPSARALRAAPVAISALLAASAAEAATAAAATTSVSAALPKTSAAVLALAAKWLAVGVVAGSLASAAATLPASGAKSVQAPRSHSVELRPRRAARVEPTAPAPAASTSALASAAPVVAPHAPPPLPAPRGRERSDVAREIALLDAATGALAAGAPDKALRFLDGTRSLSVRSLAPEATVLRVRALLQLGQRDAAKQLVDEFVKSAPNAPQAVVLRNLLSASIP